MKNMLVLLILCVSGAASAQKVPSIYEPTVVKSESFEATLMMDQKAVSCQDPTGKPNKIQQSLVKIENSMTDYGIRRIADNSARTNRIRSFNGLLPKGMTCSDLRARLPKRNESVGFTRDILLHFDVANFTMSADFTITEVVKMNLLPDVVLDGQNTWNDFSLERHDVDDSLNIVSHLTSREDLQIDSVEERGPLAIQLNCVKADLNQGQFKLTLNAENFHRPSNIGFVNRIFANETACTDALTDLVAQVQQNDPSERRGIKLQVSQRFKLSTRDRIEPNGNRTTILVRNETVTYDLLGTKFSASSSIPLWKLF